MAPQADRTLGGSLCGDRSPKVGNVQACRWEGRSLHQRVEHRTATSLLPLELQSFVFPTYILYRRGTLNE